MKTINEQLDDAEQMVLHGLYQQALLLLIKILRRSAHEP